MTWFKKLFGNKSNLPALMSGGIKESDLIPEPTRSLVFLTNEDPSKATSPFTITMTISLEDDGVKSEIDRGHNFYGEPSLIWRQLPVRRNNLLEENPMYYPAYTTLTPEQRYQYISWLKDVTQSTNLSYVFLYYYGLERHLLVGDFEGAVKEIVRLLKHHDKGSFRSYATSALIVSILHRKRFDLFTKYSFLFENVSNEVLLVRRHLGAKITPKEIMKISSSVGFKNRYYINKYPKEFLHELEELVINYEHEQGSILECVPLEELEIEENSFFANSSLPDKVRLLKTPKLLPSKQFKALVCLLLEKTHSNLKERKTRKKK